MNLKRRNFSSMIINGLHGRNTGNKLSNSLALVIKQQVVQHKKKSMGLSASETNKGLEGQAHMTRAEVETKSEAGQTSAAHDGLSERPSENVNLNTVILHKDSVGAGSETTFFKQMEKADTKTVLSPQPPAPTA